MLNRVSLLLLLVAASVSVSHGSREAVAERYREQSTAIGFALAPNMSLWEQLLLPSPAVVTLIGQMIVHSSKIDVSLATEPPKGGWKHVHQPQSLRASLLQVGNDAWEAFNTAQNNMDHVSVSMLQVPRHVQTALRTISTMPAEVLTTFVQIPLGHIEKIGQDAVTMTAEISQAFIKVMGLTAELSESVGAKQGQTDVLIVENQAKLEASKTQKQMMKEQQRKMEENYKKQGKVLDNARERYMKAIDSIPTGWKAMAMEMMHTIIPTLVSTIATVKNPLAGVGLAVAELVKDDNPKKQSEGPKLAKSNVFDPMILQSVNVIAKRLPEMEKFLEELSKDDSSKSTTEDSKSFIAIDAILETQMAVMSSFTDSNIKEKAMSLMNRIKSVALFMTKKVNNLGDLTPEEIKGQLDALKSTAGDIITLESAAKAAGLDLGMSSPASNSSGKDGFVGSNERAKANMELANLKMYEQQQDRLFSGLMEFNERLTQLEVEMERMTSQGMNLKNVREILRKVLLILGELRQLWSNLVEYFQLVANRAKVINDNYLTVFVQFSKVSSKAIHGHDGVKIRQQMVNELGKQATDIQVGPFVFFLFIPVRSESEVVCFYLHKLADTYYRISKDYLTGRLSGVAKLMTAKTDEERQAFFAELKKGTMGARAAIVDIIKETRKTYHKELEDRREKMEAYAKSLGEPTKAELDHIKAGQRLLETNEVKPSATVEDKPSESGKNEWDITKFLD